MSADKDVAFASPAIDSTTITSLLAVAFLLTISYLLSRRLLAVNTPVGLRVIYIWHLFDALIHVLFEGSFLYNCFFVFKPGNSLDGFLNQPLRTYGANYGSSPTSKLWQEYAKADARWGGADVTVISIELLTVIIGGPLAAWICEGIRRQDSKAWFWMILLATGELYGGFMTFSPEWLTGSQNLDTSNALYL
ncbi:MAG: hypothetical protein M1832_002668 [Thelocarpon impressellum]|nr:MAG: hypothetical protein M1832_002668 [Thelocarpon impressellum]